MNEGILGYTNPEGTVQNISILKNASIYMADQASKQRWTVKLIPYHTKINRLVLLRDPYERYLSALNEDINLYIRTHTHNERKKEFFNYLIKNNWFFDFFDFLFDHDLFLCEHKNHTQLQVNFIQEAIFQIGIENFTFIKITEKLGDNINMFLQLENCKSNFDNEKLHKTDTQNEIYKQIFLYFYDGRNHKKKERILEYLKPDYDFMENITFFNRY